MFGACLSIREAGLGDPAAPKTVCLPLLPSGPGGVHRVLLHRAQPLILTRHSETERQSGVSLSPFINNSELQGERTRFGGEGGIRTHGPVAETHAFQACRFVHSRTSPRTLNGEF